MSSGEIDVDKLRLHKNQPSEETRIKMEAHHPDVLVVITQAFCPNGHNLVGRSPETFDGFSGISLWVEAGDRAGEVVVSPIHGDPEKRGISFPDGTKLSLKCPECKVEFPELTRCRCAGDGRLRLIYLTPRCSESHIVAVCDIWGCPLSRVIDNNEMFSEFLDGNIGHDPE